MADSLNTINIYYIIQISRNELAIVLGVGMTRIIAVASGKGGAGKTSITANLGACLADMGYEVIVIDGNLTTPNLGMHFGIALYPVTLHDVLKGKAHISQAIYKHKSGLKIIPAGISLNDMRGVDSRDFPGAMLDLLGMADIVLVDVAAGLGREALAAIESADELVVVTNPELPTVTDALKAIKLAQRVGTKVRGVIVNRVDAHKYEMPMKDVQNMLEVPIIGKVPEDDAFHLSMKKKNPVVFCKPYSKAGKELRKISMGLVGHEPIEEDEPWYKRLFGLG